jgi:hypothetical protein
MTLWVRSRSYVYPHLWSPVLIRLPLDHTFPVSGAVLMMTLMTCLIISGAGCLLKVLALQSTSVSPSSRPSDSINQLNPPAPAASLPKRSRPSPLAAQLPTYLLRKAWREISGLIGLDWTGLDTSIQSDPRLKRFSACL